MASKWPPPALDQEPHRPLDAYYAVATHLHDSYFLTQPPAEGVVLVVQCRDGSRSQWSFGVEMAARVIADMGADPLVRSIGTIPYRSTTPAA